MRRRVSRQPETPADESGCNSRCVVVNEPQDVYETYNAMVARMLTSFSVTVFVFMRSLLVRWLFVGLACSVSSCVTTVALDRAVVAYDRTAVELLSKQLLLNIARARHNQPLHFTAISNIAATYNFAVSAGASPALTGDRGALLVPLFGASVAENPTISITPMEGEEFTQRLLTPFHEQKLTTLLRQHYDVDALLRLLAGEVRLVTDGRYEAVYNNRPSDRDGYSTFRRVVTHLSTIQDRHSLYIEPLLLQDSWIIPATAMTVEGFQTIYDNFALTYDAVTQLYTVAKKVTGRIIITNYDPAILSNQERQSLQAEAETGPSNEIMLDIRPGYPGGEYPLHGKILLRSFYNVLTFIGRDMAEEPEYDVPPDPRTPPISENPVHTLEILETESSPSAGDLSIAFNGHNYAVRPETGYQWNRKAFSLLYQLFQMTVAAAPQAGPAITIAK